MRRSEPLRARPPKIASGQKIDRGNKRDRNTRTYPFDNMIAAAIRGRLRRKKFDNPTHEIEHNLNEWTGLVPRFIQKVHYTNTQEPIFLLLI